MTACREMVPADSELVWVVEFARALDVRPFETTQAARVIDELVPSVIQAVDRAVDVCQAALDTYDHDTDIDPLSSFSENCDDTGQMLALVDQAVLSPSASRVADMAFMGRAGLVQKRAALRRLKPDTETWLVISECGSTRRRILKTLAALETALAQAQGRRSAFTFGSELARSLETRRQYAAFWRTVLGVEFTPEAAYPLFRHMGTAISILIGRDIYPDLRIADRRLLRNLQQRILDWLRMPQDHLDRTRTAQRLYDELVMFARLLTQVSRRQELVQHDQKTLARLLDPTVGLDAPTEQDALRSLLGLDPELDQILQAETPARTAWFPVVCRLLAASRPTSEYDEAESW